MTRVNGIFEVDFNVTMILIANTDDVIYTNTSSDPYGNTTSGYNSQLQNTLTSVIGEANYDVGHLFANLQNNGNAGCIGCVCVNNQKGSGWTSATNPVGDFFDVDYVAHVLGHQFGANHTWTFGGNEGTNVQVEPGSGTTIMSYAGITGSTDVEPNVTPNFHAVSIEQVTDYIKTTSCQTNTNTGNSVPVVNAGPNYTIPRGTPFILEGSATDADAGDVLSYVWEQIDENNASTTLPSTTATSGVAFRSYEPNTNPDRYFPRLQTIKAGTSTWITNAVTGISSNLTGLTAVTKYEAQVRSKCSGGTNSAYSSSVTFTTTDVQLNYCNSASTNVNDEFISRVQLNTIDNSSGAQFYSDFTGISTTLIKDTRYTITITPTWTGTIYNEAYGVWIDYNRDGDFTDAGEQVYTQGNMQATSVSGSFTIPASAVENSTRMRVTMRYKQVPGPCDNFTYGEVEDYTIIIEGNGPDTEAPVITLNGLSTLDLLVGDTYTELGATATDNVDGNLTSSIVVGGDTVNTSIPGVYVVTYNVSDATGNAATEVTRTVTVTADTTAPVITLIGASTINLEQGDSYSDQGATATDDIDGNLTSSIVVGGDTVNTSIVGSYEITYNVSDNAGNAATEVIRTVNVNQDSTIPIITLIGASSINLNIGDSYVEQGATAFDNFDGDISSNIVITGTVNTASAGTYFVNYNVSDAAGNTAATVTRTITVLEDTTPPVISLIGPSRLNLITGDTYTDQGATATDNIDVNLTSSIVVVNTVNTSVAGNYSVTYNVSDAAGNAATEVVRTVNVSDPTTGCSGGISTFPYSEGFENTLGGWSQSTADDINWTVDANGTPSNGTGPSSAIQGSFYIYVEASGNNTGYPNKRAIINSPCFDLSSATDANFNFN